MKSGIDRILSIIGLDNIIEILSSEAITWADLHTLLLHIFERKIKDVSPADIMKNCKESRFSQAAETNPRELLEIDRILYGLLPSYFLPVELSPVNAIGVNSTLTSLDPKIVLPTIRNLEVVGDPSMALSIECAKRRESLRTTKENTETHLATSHRVLRVQAFPKNSGLMAHFRAFALASSARDVTGFNSFELSALSTHVEIWLRFLTFSSDFPYSVQNISVAISDIRMMEKLISYGRIDKNKVIKRTKDKAFDTFREYSIDLPGQIDYARDIPILYPELETYIRELQFTEKKIIDPLRSKYPNVRFYFDLSRCSGIGYYSGICYTVAAENLTGKKYSLAGGGACDWTKKLLQNRREHLIASGFGTEFFHRLFRLN